MWQSSLLFALLNIVVANHTQYFLPYCYNITLPPTDSDRVAACEQLGGAKAVMTRIYVKNPTTVNSLGGVASASIAQCCWIESGPMPTGWTANADMVSGAWSFGQLVVCAPGNFLRGIYVTGSKSYSGQPDTLSVVWKKISCIKPINLDSSYGALVDVPFGSQFFSNYLPASQPPPFIGCPVGAYLIGFQMAAQNNNYSINTVSGDLVDIEFLKCAYPLSTTCRVRDAVSSDVTAIPDPACGTISDSELHQYCNITLSCPRGFYQAVGSPLDPSVNTSSVLWNTSLNRTTLSSVAEGRKDPRLASYPVVLPTDAQRQDGNYPKVWSWSPDKNGTLLLDLGIPRPIVGIVTLGGCGDPLQRFVQCSTYWVSKYNVNFVNLTTSLTVSPLQTVSANVDAFNRAVFGGQTVISVARYVWISPLEWNTSVYLRADVLVQPNEFFMIKDASVGLECSTSNQGSHLLALSLACQGQKYICTFTFNTSGVSGDNGCLTSRATVIVDWFYNGVPQPTLVQSLPPSLTKTITLVPQMPARLTCQPSVNRLGNWTGQKIQCVDMNECQRKCNGSEIPGVDECYICDDTVSKCSNLVATPSTPGFECICNLGYVLNASTGICVNVNECAAACSAGQAAVKDRCNDCKTTSTMCNDTIGSFNCLCLPGFAQNPTDSTTCLPINECNISCSTVQDGHCNRCFSLDFCVDTNTTVGFACSCPSGYTGGGFNCTDIDECRYDAQGPCGDGFFCTNYIGGYNCTCMPGFLLVNSSCVDIDECQDNSTCGGGPCENTDGSYICIPFISNVQWQLAGSSLWVNGSIVLTSVSQLVPDIVEITVENSALTLDTSVYDLDDPMVFYYGGVESSDEFQTIECDPQSRENVFLCSMGSGVGKNLFFSFEYCQQSAIVHRILCPQVQTNQFLFSYPAPTLTSGTLRTSDNVSGTTNLIVGSPSGITVFMDGTNFFASQMTVSFSSPGGSTYDCLLKQANETTLSCVMSTFIGNNLTFSVQVGQGSSAQVAAGTDTVSLVIANTNASCGGFPTITGISGCSSPLASSSPSAVNCPTQGGALINVTTSIALVWPVVVLVAGKQCPVVSLSSDNKIATCTLPDGVGRNVAAMIGHSNPTVFSLSAFLISYGTPTISSISSSSCVGVDTFTLVNCSSGGILSITGTNFGASGATVLAGGDYFNATHGTGSNAHLSLRLPFPPFKPGVLQVLVFAALGASSGTSVFVSYSFTLCGAGYMANNDGSCAACPPGSYTNSSGQRWCILCDGGKFSPSVAGSSCYSCLGGTASQSASASCSPCPAGQFSGDAASTCSLCPPGSSSFTSSVTACSVCLAGTFQPQAGMAVCENCAPGSASNQSSSIACSACLPGHYSFNEGMTSCVNCQTGRSQINSGASQCDPCAPGFYSNIEGALQCLPCPSGTSSNLSATTTCVSCSPGWFQDQCGMQNCEQCRGGTYSVSSGQIRCQPCQPGRATNLLQQQDCQDCKIGEYQSSAGQTSCEPCALGQFSLGAAILCQSCKAGKEASGQSGCRDCLAGTYRESEDASGGCQPCPAGRYQTAGDQAQCAECPAGWYSNTTVTCLQCSQGSYSTGSASACSQCPPGSYGRPFDGETQCYACEAGKYSNQSAATSCQQCLPGSFVETMAALACSPCSEGRFSSVLSTSCDKCANGQFAAGASVDKCVSCPLGTTVNDLQTSCLCPAGQYAITALDDQGVTTYKCFENPTGTVTDLAGITKNDLVTLPGYWRDNNESLTYYRCYAPQFCLGGKLSTCGNFREGPMCALCQPGYKSVGTNHQCALCPAVVETSWGITVAILLAVGVALVVAYWLILKMADTQQQELIAKERARLDATVSNLTTAGTVGDEYFAQLRTEIQDRNGALGAKDSMQSMDLAQNGDASVNRANAGEHNAEHNNIGDNSAIVEDEVEEEEPVKKEEEDEVVTYGQRRAPNFMYKIKIVVGFYQVASLLPNQGGIIWPQQFVDFINFFSFLNFDFVPWQNLACAVSMNYYTKILIVGLLPIAIIGALAAFFSMSFFFYGRKDDLATQMTKQNRILRAKRQFTKLVLFTIFLLYPFVSKTTLGVYNCIEIDGVHYLAADFMLLCGSPEWKVAAGYSAIFVALYPIGTPVIYYVLMSRVDRRSPDAFLELGFLYEAYVDGRWYWELLDMAHKLILTSIVVFMPNELIMGANMVIMVLYLILLLVCNPYLRKGDDRLHLLAQTNLFVLALMGHSLRLLDDPFKAPFASRSTVEALLSTLLIAINVLFLASFLIIAGRNIKKAYDRYMAKKKNPFPGDAKFEDSSHALRSFDQQLALVTMG